MGLIDKLSTLITEHGSAAILRERIGLLTTEREAALRKATDAETQNQRLRAEAEKLQAENEGLRLKIARLEADVNDLRLQYDQLAAKAQILTQPTGGSAPDAGRFKFTKIPPEPIPYGKL
jgi:predicted nuclease with TOPRIM domain